MASKGKKSIKAIAPVKEQSQRGQFVLEGITEAGQVVGYAYRRKPLFQTMLARGEIDRDQAQAISYYVDRYDAANRSLTKSCLAEFNGAGDSSGMVPLSLRASSDLDHMDRAMGDFLRTFKAVVIDDMSCNRIAMKRWGSIEELVGEGKKARFAVRPLCRSHPRLIKREFNEALARMMPIAFSMFTVNYYVDVSSRAGYTSGKVRAAPANDAYGANA